jgi:hypothetical protein
VPGRQLAQGLAQLRPVAADTGGLRDDLPAVRSGGSAELGLMSLGPGGDPGTADADAVVIRRARWVMCRSSRYPGCDASFETSFWDGATWAAAEGGGGPETTDSRTTRRSRFRGRRLQPTGPSSA